MADSNSWILRRDYGFDVAATRREVVRLVDLRPGPQALDIGTGEGSMAFALARRGLRVVGVDSDWESLRAARLRAKRVGVQLGKRLRFVCGDALALPFPAGEFDVVFSFDTLFPGRLRFCSLRQAASSASSTVGRARTSCWPNWLRPSRIRARAGPAVRADVGHGNRCGCKSSRHTPCAVREARLSTAV
jgi:SAM-dependent methyltransferase